MPFCGEIKLVGGTYAPQGWLLCDGTIYQIADYEALFEMIGNAFGGDGQTDFAVPNLQGNVAMGALPGTYALGHAYGEATVTLTEDQVAAHTHVANSQVRAGVVGHSAPQMGDMLSNYVLANGTLGKGYVKPPAAFTTTLAEGTVQVAQGGKQAHSNLQPYLQMSFYINWNGDWY